MSQLLKKPVPVFKVVPYGHPDFFKLYGDAWGDLETLVAYYAEDGQYTDKGSKVTVKGHAKLRRFMKVYLGHSPGNTVEFTNIVVSERSFAAEWIWEGTSDGPLRLHGFESPQDGSYFCIDGVSVCTVDNEGRILTHTDYWDSEPLLRAWKAI